MHLVESYTQQIARHYPELRVDSVRLNQAGQYNDVLIVNEALVFRFAKTAPAVAALQQELAILTCIQPYMTLSIPAPLYHQVGGQQVGEVFMGYRLIPGEPLWHETFAAITEEAVLHQMAAQLATFLKELHGIPVASLSAELTVDETPELWANLYARIQAKLFVHMRPEVRRQVAAHFDAFLSDPTRYAFTPVLRHGDFGTGNLLYDPVRGQMTGVIDFGMTSLGDPATDFAGLLSLGEAFYRRCSAFYPAMERALDRVHFYRGTFALQEALFGIEHGNAEAFRSGMEEYL